MGVDASKECEHIHEVRRVSARGGGVDTWAWIWDMEFRHGASPARSMATAGRGLPGKRDAMLI